MGVLMSIVLAQAELSGAEMRRRVPAALDALFSSVSHTNGLSAIVYGDARVGVDLEKVRERRMIERLIKRTMLESELGILDGPSGRDYGFAQHWTRVEAYLKALGLGVRGGYLTRPGAGWSVIDLDLSADYVGTIVVEAEAPLVTTRWIVTAESTL